jgi:hypothetical protein
MFTDDFEAMMRRYKCILINYQVVPLPQNWSLMDWYLWRSVSANIVVGKRYLLQDSIEVSTVFLPESVSGHFETMVFYREDDSRELQHRWDTYHEAWIGHLVVSMFIDLEILKLRGATPAIGAMQSESLARLDVLICESS